MAEKNISRVASFNTDYVRRPRAASATPSKREIIHKTLSEDYPGLDYLGCHSVLTARKTWYRVLWFTLVTSCLLIGLFTVYQIIDEYRGNPRATKITVKSVKRLRLPQFTVCPTSAETVNLKEMEVRLFKMSNKSYVPNDLSDFAYYMLAGSGFQKMNSRNFNATRRGELAQWYNDFRGKQSVQEFFNFFFNSFGLQCNQLFSYCQLGDTPLNCCEVFEPSYTIRRGRCFRTKDLYQESFDELGKLRIEIQEPHQMIASTVPIGVSEYYRKLLILHI
jgi:hypothetical protein